MYWHGEQAAPSTREGPAAETGPRVVYVPTRGFQTVLWVIAVLLALIAGVLVSGSGGWLARPAWAQMAGDAVGTAGRGIYAFPGQLDRSTYGVFMVDVDTGTLWCYEMAKGPTGETQVKLVAARSWIFDRYLEEFNVAEPIPSAVQRMVEQQQSHRDELTELPGVGEDEPDLPALPEGEQ